MESNYLKEKLKMWKIEMTPFQEQQFLSYFEILVNWNSVMNLTTITEFKEVMDKHFLDSLSICKVIDLQKNEDYKLIDVGTGAGFPGIPLKIMFPGLQITLLDSLKKRIGFLNEVLEKLKIDNVELIHGRAEDLANNEKYREKYDIATSRAVAKLSSLSEICLPFVKKDGVFVSYKAEKAIAEIQQAKNAIKTLKGTIEKEESFCLPKTDLFRSLIVIKKTGITPKKYPRKAGVPFRKPL